MTQATSCIIDEASAAGAEADEVGTWYRPIARRAGIALRADAEPKIGKRG